MCVIILRHAFLIPFSQEKGSTGMVHGLAIFDPARIVSSAEIIISINVVDLIAEPKRETPFDYVIDKQEIGLCLFAAIKPKLNKLRGPASNSAGDIIIRS